MSNLKKDLIRRAKQGDTSAFGELYETCSHELYKYACYVLGSSCLARDAVQETLCCAFSRIATLRNEESFKFWLLKELSNVCMKLSEKQSGIYAGDDIEEVSGYCTHDLEISTELKIALESLDVPERMTVILNTVYGYKSREISQALNCPAATVHSTLSHTIEKLQG